MRRLPPLNAVRAFEAAARRGNFNQAAEELSVTPSAISHQVRTLEEFFGTKLFRRSGRNVELTTKSRDFLRSVTQALDQINAASQRMMRRPEGNLLNIAVAPTFATGWLVPRMLEFQVVHPELEIRMCTTMNFADFHDSDIDLAINYSAGEFPDGLESVRIMAEHCVPVCSPQYMREHGPLHTPDDIRNCTLLHALPRIGQWRNWLEVAGVSGVDAERGPKFQSTPLALEAAKSALGVAISNREFVQDHIRQGTLVAPFQVEVPSQSGYYLIYPQERASDPKIEAFRDWLLAKVLRGEPSSSEPLLEMV
jgi:LysR family glycine cleavage system transcriptional activator